MNIDLLCTDGSPLGVTSRDVYGLGLRGMGVGGSELALLTLCEEWTKAGHRVRLYNDPLQPNASPFEQRNIHEFDASDNRDVLIVFRTPTPRAIGAKGLRCWWSCDQFTSAPFDTFAREVHKIVTISPFHANYFKDIYQIRDTITLDLPVRIDEYDADIEKIPYRCIFTSVPDRGLDVLNAFWPVIKQRVPQASLVITSDYRLWGCDSPLNETHRMMWLFKDGVQFKGAISRRELIQQQLQAQVHTYPSTYEELLCISVAESQVAGAYPITSTTGALATTNMGTLIQGDPRTPFFGEQFIHEVVTTLQDQEGLKVKQEEVRQKALERFSPARILSLWDEKVFK